MHYVVLTTGSCGNSYLFEENGEVIIVDAGITLKKLKEGLKSHDMDENNILGLFITHFHPDHSKGVGAAFRAFKMPLYSSERAKKTNKNVIISQKIPYESISTFVYGDVIKLGSFSIKPFKTYHDSEGSSGYYIENGEKSVFLMTDTGRIPEEAINLASRSKLKFIESNYDKTMLINGSYAPWLKNRVMGSYGHLDNVDAVRFASQVSKTGDHVVFVHLSSNNNKSEIVRRLAEEEIMPGIFIKVAERGAMLEGYIE